MSRYFVHCDFLSAGERTRLYFGWKSMLHGRKLLAKSLEKRIGNGRTVSVWAEKWISGSEGSFDKKNWVIDIDFYVDDLIDPSSKS